MERWCLEMGFKPSDVDSFCSTFNKKCQPRTKIIWDNIIKHVRPKSEALEIRKQCLLHKLRTGTHVEKIKALRLESEKDYAEYRRTVKDEYSLKKILKEVEKRKSSIKERLNALEQSRERSIKAEEDLKEKTYKLRQLKNKKITMIRLIDKLVNDTNFLKFITTQSNKIVGFGPDTTEWEKQVIITVKELPSGSEYQTILTKLSELLKNSKLQPLPTWDRTENLTSMENMLLSLFEKAEQCERELSAEKSRFGQMKEDIYKVILEKCDGQISGTYINCLLKAYECEILNKAKLEANELINCKPPYTLQVELQSVRRLQHEIDERIENINSLLPLESEEIKDDLQLVSAAGLPSKLPVDRLFNSLSEEISLFVKLPLSDNSGRSESYKNIDNGYTREMELAKVKKNMKKHSKLVSLEEEICSLVPPTTDAIDTKDMKNKSSEICSQIPDCITKINDLQMKVNKSYERLKAAFHFLRKEPLNERLTGIDIDGEDISYWIKRYSNAKELLDHNEWLKGKLQESEEPD